MSNITITNVDRGSVELQNGRYHDALLTFAAAHTFKPGTILGRLATGKLVPFDPGGAGGAEKPIAVLTYEVSRSAAGDQPIRPLIAGDVNEKRLVIDADGDGSNITPAILDQLRAVGIVALPVEQLGALDNQ